MPRKVDPIELEVRRLVKLVGRSAVRAMLIFVAVALVAGSFAFLYSAFEGGKVDQGVVAILLVGMATLVVVEVLPILKTFKVGKDGFEFSLRDLGEKVTVDADDLKQRVEELERLMKGPKAEPGAKPAPARGAARATAKPSAEVPEHLLRRGKYRDDPRKGLFGGESKVGDFELTASFGGDRDKAWAEVTLTVTARGKAVGKAQGVHFILHDTFSRWQIYEPFGPDWKAEISRTVWGGFTVGAWIPGPDICLELDLSELPYAPRVVKEL